MSLKSFFAKALSNADDVYDVAKYGDDVAGAALNSNAIINRKPGYGIGSYGNLVIPGMDGDSLDDLVAGVPIRKVAVDMAEDVNWIEPGLYQNVPKSIDYPIIGGRRRSTTLGESFEDLINRSRMLHTPDDVLPF